MVQKDAKHWGNSVGQAASNGAKFVVQSEAVQKQYQ